MDSEETVSTKTTKKMPAQALDHRCHQLAFLETEIVKLK